MMGIVKPLDATEAARVMQGAMDAGREPRFEFRRRPSQTGGWDNITPDEMVRAEEELARAQHRAGAIDVEFEEVKEPKALIGDGSCK